MAMQHPSIGIQVVGPESLRCPELHDFSDLPEVARANRPLLIVLALGAMLMIGHFAYQGHIAPANANLPQQFVFAGAG